MNYLWREEETEWLKENYGKLGVAECSKILQRSRQGIHVKASRFGLKDYTKLWTPDEIKVLKENYQNGLMYCCKLLGRTHASVMKKAKSYGLRVDPMSKRENYKKASKLKWHQGAKEKLRDGQKKYWRNKFKELQGKCIIKGGYILIKDYKHPNRNSQNYVLEHVKVLSEHLGRPLTKSEIIHHKDLDKQNNKIDNLYLCDNRSTHAQVHYSINKLIKKLVDKKKIIFEGGVYKDV